MGPYPRPDCGEAQIPGGWAVQLESTKNEQGFYQNKTTLYEERKRNEAPRRKKLTGFSPVGKANRGKTQSLTFAHLCWILGRCHRSVLCLRTQRFILDSGMQHVSMRARKVCTGIRSSKITLYYLPFALAMLWQGKGLVSFRGHLLLICQRFYSKNILRDPWHER